MGFHPGFQHPFAQPEIEHFAHRHLPRCPDDGPIPGAGRQGISPAEDGQGRKGIEAPRSVGQPRASTLLLKRRDPEQRFGRGLQSLALGFEPRPR